MAEHMRAWELTSPGPIEKVIRRRDDAPKPAASNLGQGQILVNVARVSLNPADYKVASLGQISRVAIPYPKTLGMDLSGHVAAVGPGVTDVKVGDAIVGRVDPLKKPGALSDFVVIDHDGYAPLPAGADLDQAAGTGTAALTALQTLKPYIKEGSEVFINGGSGGVGTFAIQIAKNLGCRVTVTCSTGKVDLCKRLGADEIIDYKKVDVITELRNKGQIFDHAVDNVSPGKLYAVCHEFLKPGAVFVGVGGDFNFGSLLSLGKGLALPGFLGGGKRKYGHYLTKNVREDFEQLAQWAGDGKLETIIESVFNFDQAVDAYDLLKKGSASGKIVVRVSEKN